MKFNAFDYVLLNHERSFGPIKKVRHSWAPSPIFWTAEHLRSIKIGRRRWLRQLQRTSWAPRKIFERVPDWTRRQGRLRNRTSLQTRPVKLAVPKEKSKLWTNRCPIKKKISGNYVPNDDFCQKYFFLIAGSLNDQHLYYVIVIITLMYTLIPKKGDSGAWTLR